MNTLSWLEILLFVSVVIGYAMYHFGYAMGKEDLTRAIGRHPAGKERTR